MNVVGYIPLGILFAGRGAGAALGFSAAISLFAEAAQIFSGGRSPSIIDVAANVIGAAIGFAVSRWLRIPLIRLPIGPRVAGVSAVLALTYLGFGARVTPSDVEDVVAAYATAPPWLTVNERGTTLPGTLEARWTFDTVDKDRTPDASGNGFDGVILNRAPLVPGVEGQAISLNGVSQGVDAGDPVALRLTGSMTLSAWIKPRAFPWNDAVIVSTLNSRRRGYQLDTSTDEGPPAIGFKLTNTSGQLMARYGKTRLLPNNWYHVAGVYDAQAHTLNVFLNGRPDDGCLRGPVTSRQHISGANAYVGRRSRPIGEEFAGEIDDVRIYSRALTQAELAAEVDRVSADVLTAPAGPVNLGCKASPPADARVAGLAVGLGMLVAMACVGLWPTASYRRLGLALSLVAGLVLVLSIASDVPTFFRWMVPILTLAGGSAIVVSSRP